MPINLWNEDQAAVWAVRYNLGRMTYAVGSCVEWLIHIWPDLHEKARSIIQRDVEEAFVADDRDRARLKGESGYKRLGMDMDRREWERVRKLWEAP